MSVIYRVENPDTAQGLWYRGDGVYNGFIRKFGDALCHDLPMDFDAQFKDGGHWLSACDNLADMKNWFNVADLKRLYQEGYDLYRIEVPSYRKINGHAAFLRSEATLISRAPIRLIAADWAWP